MLLNRIEKLFMNNPVREAVQKRFEAPRLLGLAGPLAGGRALEIGCGRGVGVELILDRFGADRVDAFDFDPEMVALARQRLDSRGDRVNLWVGDAAAVAGPDGRYDAVFDFGIIHHVPEWRLALAEIRRVLRPGGIFYAEDVFEEFIHHPLMSRILEHPMEDRFDLPRFVEALEEEGFEILAAREMWGWFGWFVARKPDHGGD